MYKFTLSLLTALLTFSIDFAAAAPVELSLQPGNAFVGAGLTQTLPIKISLKGLKSASSTRANANVAIVIDSSGSMSGSKLRQAKDGAVAAIRMLGAQDIVSVIHYSNSAHVVVPATKLTDPERVIQQIHNIQIGGSTALYAGVTFGASELRKFLSENNVSRLVLLSDGQANVGPQSPSALGGLGGSLSKEGITVSTIGIGAGYNEDLMQQLADRSDGNHVFAEQASDIYAMFQGEFKDILSVVAQRVEVTLTCAPGVRPVRALGWDAEIRGQEVRLRMNNLYADHEKYVMLEVELDPGADGTSRPIASATLNYQDSITNEAGQLSADARISFTSSQKELVAHVNKSTMEAYFIQVANLASDEVIRLRDLGKVKEAKSLLGQNAQSLTNWSQKYDLPELDRQAQYYQEQRKQLDSRDWQTHRKSLKGNYQLNKRNQTYGGK